MTARLLIAVLVAWPMAAQDRHQPEVPLPDAARRFVAAGTRPIAFETGDLNRDGRSDAILVIETAAAPADDDLDGRQRTLIVLVGQPDGTFREAARNASIAFCSECGGIMGDPFQGVDVGPGTFTVTNAGGSGWRWASHYTFNYSRRDDAWQLVKVVEHEMHAANPADMKTTTSAPPKHYGKIDIADFHPESWKGQGAK